MNHKMAIQLMSHEQRKAIYKLYKKNPDGSKSYREFRKRAMQMPYIGCAGLTWCGMFVGIERDGYTHS